MKRERRKSNDVERKDTSRDGKLTLAVTVAKRLGL